MTRISTNSRPRLTRRAFLKSVMVGSAMVLSPALVGCARKCSLDSLTIIPRTEWGAVEPNVQGSVEGPYDADTNPGGWYVYEEPLVQALNTIVVHHSALPLSDGPLEIQHKHMHTKGYADIAYQFIIDGVGRVYEGRSLEVRGAHTGGHNTGTIGIVLMGHFERAKPTEAQLTSLGQLGLCLRDEFEITHIAGHRDFQPKVTVCPGKNLEALLPGLAKELELEFGTGGYVGPP
jgi:hypothetical protein